MKLLATMRAPFRESECLSMLANLVDFGLQRLSALVADAASLLEQDRLALALVWDSALSSLIYNSISQYLLSYQDDKSKMIVAL